MKKYFILIMTSVLATACMNDFDEVVPDNQTIITCDSIGAPTTTIAQIRSRYATVIGNSSYERVNEDVIIEGIVTGNDLSGNIYQQIYIQDIDEQGRSKTEPGISVGIKGYGALYCFFPVGQKVRINLKGLYVGGYGKLAKIGQPYINTNGALRMGPMTAMYTTTNIMKVGLPNEANVVAREVSASDVAANNIDKMTPMLIKISGAEIADAGQPFAHYDDYLEAKDNYSVEHTIKMADGGKVTLYTSTSATFAGDTIPAGKHTIYGILSRYTSSYQLQLRSIDDLVAE